jgi:2-haloacid dehalogenase
MEHGEWRASWVLFDLNGTVLDPTVIAEPLGGGEEARGLVGEAFRDALMMTMADTISGGAYRPLPEYLLAGLERRLRAAGRDTGSLDAAMERAAAMDPFPDAASALAVLREAGLRVGVLTNSAAEAANRALEAAGLRDPFDIVMGSDTVEVFKPHPRVYEYAVGQLEVEPADVCFVAAHAWDVVGAMRAGLRGAWVARSERWLVPAVPKPDLCGDDLEDVARKIAMGARAAGT